MCFLSYNKHMKTRIVALPEGFHAFDKLLYSNKTPLCPKLLLSSPGECVLVSSSSVIWFAVRE